MARSIQTRLKAACRGGNLTLSDLARYFGTPYPTLRGWVQHGREPRGTPRDIEHFNSLLSLLETLIRRKKFLPVPKMSERKRIAYLADMRRTLFPKIKERGA